MNHEIFLRCHTRVLDEKPKQQLQDKKAPRLRYVLVLDTETTTDACQSLNFGAYQFCQAGPSSNYTLREEGLLYADDLDRRKLTVLQRYVQNANGKSRISRMSKLKLYDRSTFVEKVLY